MTPKNAAIAASLTLLLTSCAPSGQEELQAWMNEQLQITKPQVQPISEPKKFTPQAYTQESVTDPFSNQKLTQALKRSAVGK